MLQKRRDALVPMILHRVDQVQMCMVLYTMSNCLNGVKRIARKFYGIQGRINFYLFYTILGLNHSLNVQNHLGGCRSSRIH